MNRTGISLKSAFETTFSATAEGLSPELPPPNEGEPVFTEADLAEAATPLDRLIRTIYRERGITGELLRALHSNYFIGVVQCDQDEAHTKRGNLLKALRKGNITFRVAMAALQAIGLELTDLAVCVHDRNGGGIHRYNAPVSYR